MTKADTLYISTQTAFAVALLGILGLGLLPMLLSGLLVYYIVVGGARRLERLGARALFSKVAVIATFTIFVLLVFSVGIAKITAQFSAGPEGIVALMQKMADVVASGRTHLPAEFQAWLPANMAEMQAAASGWLRKNALIIGVFGRDALVMLAHIVIGMVIGAMVALNPAFPPARGILAKAMAERMSFLGRAFRRVVFSQIRISALNTVLTGIFLIVVLPAFGVPLPFTKTMIVVTFIVGLLPIIGNLISNTVIFLVGLSVSPVAAIGTLIYLVFIHKLEYFVNARIIGGQIRARAWEILLAMLVMEAVFGIAGLVAAPIYYAYIKDELGSRDLI